MHICGVLFVLFILHYSSFIIHSSHTRSFNEEWIMKSLRWWIMNNWGCFSPVGRKAFFINFSDFYRCISARSFARASFRLCSRIRIGESLPPGGNVIKLSQNTYKRRRPLSSKKSRGGGLFCIRIWKNHLEFTGVFGREAIAIIEPTVQVHFKDWNELYRNG